MLDTFEILTTSGVVLWSRTYAPVSPSIVNNFIADTFIEEKSGSTALRDKQSASSNPAYKHEQHTLKWALSKEIGVIFVVCLAASLVFILGGNLFSHDLFRSYTGRYYTSAG